MLRAGWMSLLLSVVMMATLPAAAWGAQAAPAATPGIAGDYAGTLGSLHLVLHVLKGADGKLGGSLDSVDQNAMGIACEGFALTGSKFSFTVPAVHGSFEGQISADGKTITGTWDQGAPQPLVLTRNTGAPAFVPAEKPSPVDGDWRGAIETPGGTLPVVIHVKSDRAGKEYVTFDSPSQGALGLPCENAVFQDGTFSFDLNLVHGRYEGKLSADGNTITGTWSQGSPLPLIVTKQAPFVAADKPSIVDGDWSGDLAAAPVTLHVLLHVKSDKAGVEHAALDSPDQLKKDIECTNAVLAGEKFSFEIPSLHGNYAGSVHAQQRIIAGTWTQAGTSLPLNFAVAPVSAAAPAPTPGAPLSLPALETKLAAELRPLTDTTMLAGMSGLGIAVGVCDKGERKMLTFGTAKPNSLFEIGSITKSFTGLILSEMVVDGKVTLDTPVRELLPAGTVTKPDGPEITLLSLATHHSGMERMPDNFHPADPTNPYADYTIKNLYEYMAKTGVARKPDAPFAYSNLGMGLLGEALANKAGKPYYELLREDVLKPLHMDHSFIAIPAGEEKNFLPAHDEDGKPIHAWDLDSMAPAGGIRSDAGDMLRYLEAQLHPPAPLAKAINFQHELRADMDNNKIAINWMYQVAGKNYNHGGATGGYASFAFFNVEHDVAGIVLINSPGSLADSLGMRVAELLEGEKAYPIHR